MTSVGWRLTAVLAATALAATGCHDAARSDEARRDVGGPSGVTGSASARTRVWPSGVPDREACHTHDDCTVMVWDGPMPPDPCCDQRVGYLPAARAYLQFFETYRKASCAGVACPTPPLPGAEPACCASIGRCVAQRCVSACDDPTAHVAALSVLDPACHQPLPDDRAPCDADATPTAYAGRASSAAYAQLTTCCSALRRVGPLLQYGAPYELTDAADVCDEQAARLANGCAPTRLAELKQQLRKLRVPGCKLR